MSLDHGTHEARPAILRGILALQLQFPNLWNISKGNARWCFQDYVQIVSFSAAASVPNTWCHFPISVETPLIVPVNGF